MGYVLYISNLYLYLVIYLFISPNSYNKESKY
jgi:hypothetical protein